MTIPPPEMWFCGLCSLDTLLGTNLARPRIKNDCMRIGIKKTKRFFLFVFGCYQIIIHGCKVDGPYAKLETHKRQSWDNGKRQKEKKKTNNTDLVCQTLSESWQFEISIHGKGQEKKRTWQEVEEDVKGLQGESRGRCKKFFRSKDFIHLRQTDITELVLSNLNVAKCLVLSLCDLYVIKYVKTNSTVPMWRYMRFIIGIRNGHEADYIYDLLPIQRISDFLFDLLRRSGYPKKLWIFVNFLRISHQL